MIKRILLLLVVVIAGTAMRSDKPAYQFFDLKGRKADYKDVLIAAREADIVLFGEIHTSPVCHWLQLELTQDLFEEKKDNLLLGAEMFESDNQLLLDEYLSGKIREKNFEEEARLWKNYKTDYKPLVKFALDNQLRFIATNVPRRYAALVNNKGFEALDELSEDAKKLMPPLPIPYDPELPGYISMVEMMKEMDPSHATDNIAKAQALKDATMAHFILQNWQEGKLFLHYNGSYHSEKFEGIVWYIRQANPEVRIMTIASVEQEQLDSLTGDHTGLADFTLCSPLNMTRTN